MSFFFLTIESEIFTQKSEIIKCLIYLILTHTECALLFFLFECKIDCSITVDQSRKLNFEILTESNLLKQLDTSNNLGMELNVCNP